MRHDHRFYAATGLGVAAVVIAIVVAKPGRAPAAAGDLGEPSGAIVPWCAPGLEPIAGGGCFAMPAGRAKGPAPLVVYLHGRYAPETLDEEHARQSRVAKLGTKKGFAVLALRGQQGRCSDPALATFWCWPSNERMVGEGPGYVDAWTTSMRVAEHRAGKGRRLLLGFSSGGYFATMIATRDLAPFDAIAIAHAGPVEPTQPTNGRAPPLLLLTADDDPSNDEMLRLDQELDRVRWPHHVFAREGGHELPDADVEAALTFFERTEKEHLPLRPPLSTRAPRRKPPDAGTGDAGAAPSATASATAESSATATPSAEPAPTVEPSAEPKAGAAEPSDPAP
jgi:hypothetical protein